MKKTLVKSFLSVLALVLVYSTPVVFSQTTLAIGADWPMATREMPIVPDGVATIASVKGEKGTVIVFWCNTCPWVKRYEERLTNLAEMYQEKGFGFIAVNPNDPVGYPGDTFDEMKKQSAAGGYSFPYAVDDGSELALAFGAKRTPQLFVFDSADKLVYQGAIDDSPADPAKVEDAYLVNALDAIVSGEAVALAETKAFGCTIKFQ
jgi:thiol-disulfide isomerase/thioredoxin